jgi:hypothetical protein
MRNFDKLSSYVEEGSVRIIHGEAVPRSIGTALSRALNESGASSIFVNEPFNGMKHDINDASDTILHAIEGNRPDNGCLTVITKNIARNLDLDVFKVWTDKVVDGIVWSVRDPMVQIGSLITRVANDRTFEPGVDRMTQEELSPAHIRIACDYLQNVPIPDGFSKTSWSDIRTHYLNDDSGLQSVVIDGGDLTTHPADILRNAAEALGLPFSYTMVVGWVHDYVRANRGHNPKLTDSERAWTREAVTSTGIMTAPRQPISMESLTPAMQAHLNEVAIPTYLMMTGKSYEETSHNATEDSTQLTDWENEL